ncbi:MAG TPA: fumarylacetoacetate hydrolase family protein [Alphaproteobacteria bacterium]|nr:fumarylacetoacetate hydrolase family protein [Alphaproteobacteria bacterium]
MTIWVRFEEQGRPGFGTLAGDKIEIHEGDMFAGAKPTGRSVALAAVALAIPCVPSKFIGLWNNFHALAEKNNFKEPAEPLYFFKSANAYQPANTRIPRPKSYPGRVVYEGELGIVIGKRCTAVSEAEAAAHIFGYTCVNDVTGFDVLNKDPAFPQWARAKSYDGFGVFGPGIATGLDPDKLVIRTLLNGEERQNYPVADMFFRPHRLVSLISQDLTLLPGDLIACGTSLGAGSMKPGAKIEISIDGVGVLSNTME